MSASAPPVVRSEANKELFEACKKLVKVAGGIPPQYVRTSFPKRSESASSQPPARWKYTEFTIEARTDGLMLKHWQKEGASNPYSKIGRKLDVVKYNDQEYKELLAELNPSWSKAETDLLFELCENFELRFIVIADRFAQHTEYKRSIEELKERYFSIAKRLLEHRGDVNNQIVKKPFNFNYEVRRKINLEKIFLRAAEHQACERQILEEVKKNEQNIIKKEREYKNLQRLMSNEDLNDNEADPLSNYRKVMRSPKLPFTVVNANGGQPSPTNKEQPKEKASGIYLRSQLLSAPLPIPEKAQKKLNQILKEFGVPDKLPPTAATVQLYDQLRKEILTLLGLEKHLQKKQQEKIILEQKYEDLQKSIKNAPQPAQMVPGQGINPRMMTPGNPHMLGPNGIPFSPNMSGRIQPPSNPNYHPSYSASMRYSMTQQNRAPHQYVRSPYENNKTEEGSISLNVNHVRVIPVTPPPAAEPNQTSAVVKTEENVKQEDKIETPMPEKTKGKRKPRSERKSKRVTADDGVPDNSSEKKKKKY